MKTIYWIPICVALVCATGVTTYLIASRSSETSKPAAATTRVSDDIQEKVPQLATRRGELRGNLNYKGVENLLLDACERTNWKVLSKGKDFMIINFDHKGISFDATLRFTNSKYSIVYKRLKQDRGDRAKAYEVYRKYVEKLNKVIQKLVYKSRY